MALKLRSFWD